MNATLHYTISLIEARVECLNAYHATIYQGGAPRARLSLCCRGHSCPCQCKHARCSWACSCEDCEFELSSPAHPSHGHPDGKARWQQYRLNDQHLCGECISESLTIKLRTTNTISAVSAPASSTPLVFAAHAFKPSCSR